VFLTPAKRELHQQTSHLTRFFLPKASGKKNVSEGLWVCVHRSQRGFSIRLLQPPQCKQHRARRIHQSEEGHLRDAHPRNPGLEGNTLKRDEASPENTISLPLFSFSPETPDVWTGVTFHPVIPGVSEHIINLLTSTHREEPAGIALRRV